MDVIIRLIIRLLEEVFSADSQKRRKEREAQARPQAAGSPKAQAFGGRRGGNDLLSQVLQEIEAMPPHAAQNQAAVPPVPPPVPVVERRETMAEHLAELDLRDSLREAEMEERLHLDHKGAEKTSDKAFILPGGNPLEQLILANVIMGPCKARGKNPRLGI